VSTLPSLHIARPRLMRVQARRGGGPKLHGMHVLKARIGLAVPGRPISPWSRRTGAPQASATDGTGARRYTVGTRGVGR
jgi:hypothetical protein